MRDVAQHAADRFLDNQLAVARRLRDLADEVERERPNVERNGNQAYTLTAATIVNHVNAKVSNLRLDLLVTYGGEFAEHYEGPHL